MIIWSSAQTATCWLRAVGALAVAVGSACAGVAVGSGAVGVAVGVGAAVGVGVAVDAALRSRGVGVGAASVGVAIGVAIGVGVVLTFGTEPLPDPLRSVAVWLSDRHPDWTLDLHVTNLDLPVLLARLRLHRIQHRLAVMPHLDLVHLLRRAPDGTVYAASQNGVYRSTDAGATFAPFDTGLVNIGGARNLAITDSAASPTAVSGTMASSVA